MRPVSTTDVGSLGAAIGRRELEPVVRRSLRNETAVLGEWRSRRSPLSDVPEAWRLLLDRLLDLADEACHLLPLVARSGGRS